LGKKTLSAIDEKCNPFGWACLQKKEPKKFVKRSDGEKKKTFGRVLEGKLTLQGCLGNIGSHF